MPLKYIKSLQNFPPRKDLLIPLPDVFLLFLANQHPIQTNGSAANGGRSISVIYSALSDRYSFGFFPMTFWNALENLLVFT